MDASAAGPEVMDEAIARQRTFLGHPIALYVLFFAELWERFSYYGMRALLVFYMTKQLLYRDGMAYDVYGAYTALVYATPVLGGLLADRVLGARRSIILGGVLMAFGHFAMAIENSYFFYGALALLIIGNGFFKPNISSLVGKLYPQGDPRRDGAFTIFYMGINLGAFLSPIVCGTVGETIGWHWGFGLAGVGMVFGLMVFVLAPMIAPEIFGKHGLAPEDRPRPFGLDSMFIVPAVAVALVPPIAILVNYSGVIDWLLGFVGLIVLAVLLYTAFSEERDARDKLLVVIVLIFFSALFWTFFEQAGSSISLFTDRNVDRHFFGWEIPASLFQAVNPIFIIALGPLFAIMWTQLGKANVEPSTPLKFALGILQLGLGFGVLALGARLADPGTAMAPLWALILGYLLHTTGELCTSPVGLSMVTKLSPAKSVGFVMGAWFLSSAFAQKAGSYVAKLTSSSEAEAAAVAQAHQVTGSITAQLGGIGVAAPTGVNDVGTGLLGLIGQNNLPAAVSLPLYEHVFVIVTVVCVVAAVLCGLLVPLLKRGMHGVN